MNKLWLTLITQNREKDIDELTRDTYDYFDGIIAVVNLPSSDKTQEILESRKKAGKIITRPFVPHHAHLMNEFLFAGAIKNLDWFMIVDSPERIRLSWLKGLREDIEYFNKNGIGGVFLDRIYLARYIDSMEFFGGVHWGLRPFTGQIVNYSQIDGYRKENYIINTRDLLQSGFRNPAKYYYQYGANSQTQLMYQQFNKWQEHEDLRMRFRLHCQLEIGIDLTLDALIKYMQENVGKYTPFFEQVLEIEVNIKDMFRLYVLNEPLQNLIDKRFNWSYFHWKNTGDIEQKENGNYIGVFNKYLIMKGEPTQ